METKPLLIGGAWRVDGGDARGALALTTRSCWRDFSVASAAEVDEALASAARAAAEMRELPRHARRGLSARHRGRHPRSLGRVRAHHRDGSRQAHQDGARRGRARRDDVHARVGGGAPLRGRGRPARRAGRRARAARAGRSVSRAASSSASRPSTSPSTSSRTRSRPRSPRATPSSSSRARARR